jgi:hypothetical protein
MEEVIMTMTPNTTRGQALATRLEETTDSLIAQVEPCSEAQWRTSAPNEGCSVGTMVHHIAVQAPIVAGWGAQVGNGEIPPVTMEMVHADNAAHAAAHASPDKAETLDLLRRNTAIAADMLRGLSDVQLEQTVPLPLLGGQPFSAQMIIEMVLIGHIQGYPHSHLPNIETALAG